MANEYLWKLKVDEEEHVFKCVVEEAVCRTYEDDVLTNTFSFKQLGKKELQLDEKITIWGKKCGFQLEDNIPYIQMDGKWAASDTTHAWREKKALQNAKINTWVQFGFGAALCAACGIYYLVKGELGNWWFGLIMGSMMMVTGLVQRNELKKNFEKKIEG